MWVLAQRRGSHQGRCASREVRRRARSARMRMWWTSPCDNTYASCVGGDATDNCRTKSVTSLPAQTEPAGQPPSGGERRRPVEPSAQPRMVRIHHPPPPAKSRCELRIRRSGAPPETGVRQPASSRALPPRDESHGRMTDQHLAPCAPGLAQHRPGCGWVNRCRTVGSAATTARTGGRSRTERRGHRARGSAGRALPPGVPGPHGCLPRRRPWRADPRRRLVTAGPGTRAGRRRSGSAVRSGPRPGVPCGGGRSGADRANRRHLPGAATAGRWGDGHIKVLRSAPAHCTPTVTCLDTWRTAPTPDVGVATVSGEMLATMLGTLRHRRPHRCLTRLIRMCR